MKMIENSSNWAGNYMYGARQIHQPQTVEQIQELVYRSNKVKALGTRHSFNDIADSAGELISLKQFDKIIHLDREHHTVTVEAGVRYGELCRWLDREGFALHNLASLPHISIAGACVTATHGSGDRLGNLATAVSGMELVTANGELIALTRGTKNFNGAVVNLGGLGIITRVSLDISPGFQMQQYVYENLPLPQLKNHYDELTARGYSVSLFTDWSRGIINQVWLKRLSPEGASIRAEPQLFGAQLAKVHLHPIPALSAENCTEQMGVRGPWFERLPHFRLEFTPSSGEELQSEYILPRQHAITAFQAVDELREYVAPLLQISEIRTIAADQLWMSPSYQRDCIAIHFTWKKDWESVRQVLPMLEDSLAQFDARPHWGKLFTIPPGHLQPLFGKLPEFRQLLQHYDPQGKFRNAFLDQYIFA
jgi:xylitol oxidase